ncbi:MAG: ATP-binding protein, partial [Saprospiraceae bacterium]|nr:ATP-binding protein [Saprospiraceae bacterium]
MEDLELGNVNLLVSKNATGKSRTLSTIDLLVKMITQKRDLNWGAKWSVVFENDQQAEVFYEFKTSSLKHGVTAEKMTVGKEVVLRRSSYDQATVRSAQTAEFERFFPPVDKLVLHVRRDVVEYPFFEEVASWAENSFGFKFGNISPLAQLNLQEYDLLTTVEK